MSRTEASGWGFSLLQILLVLAGMVWKAREGFPIVDFLDTSGDTCSWLNPCIVPPALSCWNNWPWFALHLFLYTTQLVGLSAIILPPVYLIRMLGLSTALPLISLWVLHRRRRTGKGWATTFPPRHGEEAFLWRVLWFTGLAHVASFLVATAASFLGREDMAPWHLTNTLLGTPDCSYLPCSQIAERQARLRQINEMTGTSSGFFLAVALFSQHLEMNGARLGAGLLARLFFVSLIAGPAAGAADALLLRSAFMRTRRST
uniref:Terpene cyclase idtS n=1 Tax=Claviceps paspali TaxID=40601 RepID=IDTS_CLAPA|nr:RecName: Full=Indole-diterpene biosynthesis cluster protein S [Claviceps paspali]AFO85423.1 IdtS [Claviceps paspali]